MAAFPYYKWLFRLCTGATQHHGFTNANSQITGPGAPWNPPTTSSSRSSSTCEYCRMKPQCFDGVKTHPYCSKSCASNAKVNGSQKTFDGNHNRNSSASGTCDLCHKSPGHAFCSKTCARNASSITHSGGNPKDPGCSNRAHATFKERTYGEYSQDNAKGGKEGQITLLPSESLSEGHHIPQEISRCPCSAQDLSSSSPPQHRCRSNSAPSLCDADLPSPSQSRRTPRTSIDMATSAAATMKPMAMNPAISPNSPTVGKSNASMTEAIWLLKAGVSKPMTVMTVPARILFYHKDNPYYGFTNFSAHSVHYDGKRYPTSEHLFQSFKFQEHRPDIAEHIRICSERPSAAFQEARRYQPQVRSDWLKVNIEKMNETIRLKFTQHGDLRKELLDTADAELVEDSDKDSFWGIGSDGKGRNELGKALERLRAEFRRDL